VLISYPDLPISARRAEVLAAIRTHQVLVLAGETGSGKTTQLPKMCLEALGEQRGQIGCTQPRRVAAMSVSRRVAEELGVSWGREVGCKMRFNDDTSRDTRVKFMTDGILLAEIQSDPLLQRYSAIILDEAHERSLNIDFLLGYLQTLLPKRPELKVLITSATIDTAAFSAAFGQAPIIEVSGRTYPVEVRYRPAQALEEEGDLLEAVAQTVDEVWKESGDGDVLVFLPTEKEIREAVDLLAGRMHGRAEVLPLFGRMSSADQQRVFQPGKKRRIVVATNVAETSVTIPRISYVIDSGLARVSRYNPRTRTKRLPIEAISQSSANQRAGRAGRVREGVCIRLYDAEDFAKRPQFSQPEIQRANLAEVILRMKAFQLGRIEDFPFLNPPSQAAIRGGYELLRELGSLTETDELTPLGRELAKLPVDPTLGRMLLQARQEGCLKEMLIIATGLSLPDPRERPEHGREQAMAAHKAFQAPESDFISLLKIWQAMPDPEKTGSNALRKFCKANWLSFLRMKEWRDLHRQIAELFKQGHEGSAEANDEAIHRCILAGHLGHIATKKERNLYKAASNREVLVFPGSNLYERREKNSPRGEVRSRQPAWIVAGEIVQTSQLFARTVARIDPLWAAELGEHLVEKRYGDPHWNAKGGRVLVTEKWLLHGLEVKRVNVDYGKVNAIDATHLFIRGALLEGALDLPHRFYRHNQQLRQKIETALTRIRSSRAYAVEEHLFTFYEARLKHCSSVHDLNRIVQERTRENPAWLCATEEELAGGDDIRSDLQLFPDQVALGNTVLPLHYQYKPGEEQDGVTVQVPLPVAAQLTSGQVQWLVPGHREELAQVLLRALPRVLRRQLMPIEPKAREIAQRFQPARMDFLTALALHLSQHYGVSIQASDWPADALPTHLQPRLQVIDQKNNTVVEGRDLVAIQKTVEQSAPKSDAWERAVMREEKHALRSWSFGDLARELVVEEIAGAAVVAYPGLVLREGREVDVRLFRSRDKADAGTPQAVRWLAEMELGKDLAWLQKELKQLTAAKPAPQRAVGAFDQLQVTSSPIPQATARTGAQEHLLTHLLRLEPLHPLTKARFEALVATVRKELPRHIQKLKELLGQVESQRVAIQQSRHRYAGMEADLSRLLPADLLAGTSHAQLQHLPRYLRAILIRAERASFNPQKDAEKAALIADFEGWEDYVPESKREDFRWLLEEYRVSVFAPELGTAQPVSVKRLEALMQ
jgi:ATP-dependent helicase HrpA